MIPLNKVSLITLRSWCNMQYLHDYLDRNGVFNKKVSKEGFDFFAQRYFAGLKKRIVYCESIEPKDEFVFYTLAQHYNRIDLDESKENLYKRKARYYAIRSIKKNQKYSRSWFLLAKIYSWVSLIGGNEKGKDRSIYFVEKAITCLKKALK